jgi:T5orf172 domain
MYTVGFVYVLSNEAMPGIVKVGMTTKLAEDRAKQLRGTGVPLPFHVEFRSATSHPHDLEEIGCSQRSSGRQVQGDGERVIARCVGEVVAVDTGGLVSDRDDPWPGQPDINDVAHADGIAGSGGGEPGRQPGEPAIYGSAQLRVDPLLDGLILEPVDTEIIQPGAGGTTVGPGDRGQRKGRWRAWRRLRPTVPVPCTAGCPTAHRPPR